MSEQWRWRCQVNGIYGACLEWWWFDNIRVTAIKRTYALVSLTVKIGRHMKNLGPEKCCLWKLVGRTWPRIRSITRREFVWFIHGLSSKGHMETRRDVKSTSRSSWIGYFWSNVLSSEDPWHPDHASTPVGPQRTHRRAIKQNHI